MKNIIVILGIICLTSCGPSAAKLHEQFGDYYKDSAEVYYNQYGDFWVESLSVRGSVTKPQQLTLGRDNDLEWPNQTYLASDFNLTTGVVVKWSRRWSELPDDLTEENFPTDVLIFIKGFDGTTKVNKCTFQIWNSLQTNDTLK